MPRYAVQPRDVPLDAAARLLGISASALADRLPNLVARGFPRPDPDTGNFDLAAINRWCDRRHPHLFQEAPANPARAAGDVVSDRLARMRADHDARR